VPSRSDRVSGATRSYYELRERILREIAAFVGDAPQHDDMTMILLRIDEFAGASRQASRVAEMAPL